MDSQNNGNVAPVGGEISSPTPTSGGPDGQAADVQQPIFESPSSNTEPAAPATAAAPAAPVQSVDGISPVNPSEPVNQAPVEPAAPAQPAMSNPTAQFAQSTVGMNQPSDANAAPAMPAAGYPAVPNGQTTAQVPYPTATNTTAAVPAGKKGSAGKIIALIVVLLLVIGGTVGGILFYSAHEKDERVLADALKSVIARKASTNESKLTLKVPDEDVKVELNAKTTTNANLETFGSIEAKISVADYLPDLNAKFGMIEGKDAIYVRVADYGSIVKSTVDLLRKLEESQSSYTYSSTQDEIEEQITAVETILMAVTTSVGTDWYQIPYSELGSDFEDSLSCVRGVSQDLADGKYNGELLDTFNEYPFIAIDGKPEKQSGYKLYTVKLDKKNGEKFFDEVENLQFYKDMNSCADSSSYSFMGSKGLEVVGRFLGGSIEAAQSGNTGDWKKFVTEYDVDLDFDFDWDVDYDWDDDDWDWYDDDDDYYSDIAREREEPDINDMLTLKLGIKSWSHDLVLVKGDIQDEDEEIKIDFEINLADGGDFDIPSNAKTLKDLIESVQSSVMPVFLDEYYSMYCTEEANYAGYKNETECKAAVDKEFGGGMEDFDIEELIDGLSYYI